MSGLMPQQMPAVGTAPRRPRTDTPLSRETLSGVSPKSGAAADQCVHCGLGLGQGHRAEDGPFCCHGCRTVYELIHSEGLDRFYDLKQCAITPPGNLRPETFAWLEPLVNASPALPGSSVRRLQLDIQGVHCAACVWLLEQLFARHGAGRQLRINPALGTVDLAWDTDAGDLRDFLADVERFGYRCGPPRKETPKRSRDLLTRLGICVAAAMNVMIFSLCYYIGMAPEDGAIYELFGQLNIGLATIAVAVGGWPFARGAWHGLRRGVAHLDLPIALGMALSYLGSTYTYFAHGVEAAYFDTITIFVTLMLVGRWLREHVLERNRNALLSSAGVADLFARRFRGDDLQVISASEIRTGDELWIAPGDLVPAAGILMHRAASIALDWITGEADPHAASPGDTVPSGAFNAGRQGFRVTATEDFSASRLNDLLSANGAEDRDSPAASSWWHRVSTIYVTAIVVLASLGFVLWIGEGARRAVEVSVAVLVVTCPCALGLALPLGRELIHALLRRYGVLLRRDGFLDRALRVRQVVFDKTGTLTKGQLSLLPDSRTALRGLDDASQRVLWNMTSRSNHPVSRCVAAALSLGVLPTDDQPAATVLADADAVIEETGRGLHWTRGDVEYRFGKPSFVAGPGFPVEPGGDGPPRALFAMDDRILLEVELQEEVKADAADEVAALEAAGYTVHLLSGDAPEKVAAVARRVGLATGQIHGALTPEGKAQVVADLNRGDTMMVGDGLNDSLSFDAALCAGTPAVDRAVLPSKADFYFLGDGIAAVRRSLQAAARLRRVQNGNLVYAVLYNGIAVALSLAGLVSPVVAAILMPVSSVTIVVLTSRRLSRGEARWIS